MKRSTTTIACLFVSVLAWASSAPEEFDRPLHFTSADEIYRLAVTPPHRLHPQYGAALTYLLQYVPRSDKRLSEDERRAMLLQLTNGLSPRQIMILAFNLRVEILKLALEADEIASADTQRSDEERKFLKMRASHADMEIEMDYGVLKSLLPGAPVDNSPDIVEVESPEEPNQPAQPTRGKAPRG